MPDLSDCLAAIGTRDTISNMLKRVESGQLEIAYEESGSIEGNPIAAAHGSSFIKSTAGRAPLRALDVLEGSRLLAPVKR